jgi:hypothetical protein
MVNYIRADESHQILIFVVLPLLLLLATATFLQIRHNKPSTAQYATFSVTLSRTGREDAYVIYKNNNGKRLEFYIGPGRGKKVYLQAPRELPLEAIREIVPNLAVGLATIGFQQYCIRKEGEPQIIAEGLTGQGGELSVSPPL